MKNKHKKKFNRYELKYLLSHRDYIKISEELQNYMKPDINTGENQCYRIASLYYDSPDFSCYRNKIDGIKYRRKLRLRIYKDSDVNNGFVEIKQRINRTVQKRRLCLPLDKAKELCSGIDVGINKFDTEDRTTAAEVMFLVKAMGMKPKCIISYQRRAFEGSRYDYGLRVTFDTCLKYRLHELDHESSCNDNFFLPPNVVVMEIKANEKVPIWLTSLISAYQCHIDRISKYCLGVRRGLSLFEFGRIYH
ncbi:polyphosphate polymerase domain-containing protein [Desulfococcaceae bacterium HSG7]|nr:polyphosphate polymerase domain-containing protein [Desulfococcaceae bacterium HSG7]